MNCPCCKTKMKVDTETGLGAIFLCPNPACARAIPIDLAGTQEEEDAKEKERVRGQEKEK